MTIVYLQNGDLLAADVEGHCAAIQTCLSQELSSLCAGIVSKRRRIGQDD